MPIERAKRLTYLFVIALAATLAAPAMAASGRLPPLRNGDIVLQDHGGLDGEAVLAQGVGQSEFVEKG